MTRVRWLVVLAACLAAITSPALGQTVYGPPSAPEPALAPIPLTPMLDASGLGGGDSLNPLDVLRAAAGALPGKGEAPGSGRESAPGLSSVVSVMVLLTVITLSPAIILMCTCFIRVIVVLGLLKQAIGAQSIPPPQVITALALFVTALVMAPTVERIHADAIVPYQRGEVADVEDLWNRGKQPVRDFMFAQIDATGNWSSVYMVLRHRGVDTSEPERLTRADVDMVTLIPAFMLSELKTAFVMGFRVYLPFLVIDMVISGLLISMSMMMLPPVLISLPFKLLLFVLVDGWALVVGNLMKSFAQPAAVEVARLVSAAAGAFA